MNILSSFMGCMYPNSIRTESIESFEQDHTVSSFEAENIDENGRIVSRGELQLTEDSLIYFKPSKFPTRWQIRWIRRYGSIDGTDKFVFEVGRKCPSGAAVYAFRIYNDPRDLVKKLNEIVDKLMKADLTSGTKSLEGSTCIQSLQNRGRHFKDASTLTEYNRIDTRCNDDLYSIPYAKIDFYITKALGDLTQSHASTKDGPLLEVLNSGSRAS